MTVHPSHLNTLSRRCAEFRQRGFSLIELVVVILIVGILAVTAGPVFFERDGVDEYVFQSRLVSVLRMQQQKAMQDTSQCYGVRIEADRFAAIDDCTASAIPNPLPTEGSGISSGEAVDANLAIANSAAAVPYNLAFNALGCPVQAPANCSAAVDHEFTITGTMSVKVCVSNQGYVAVGACP